MTPPSAEPPAQPAYPEPPGHPGERSGKPQHPAQHPAQGQTVSDRKLLGRMLLALPLLLFALTGLWVLRAALPQTRPVSVNYAEFTRLLEAGRIDRVVVRENVATVTLTGETAVNVDTPQGSQSRNIQGFTVQLPSGLSTPGSGLIQQLEAGNVDFKFEQPSQWLGILLNFLPVLLALLVPALLLAALVVWAVRQGQRHTGP